MSEKLSPQPENNNELSRNAVDRQFSDILSYNNLDTDDSDKQLSMIDTDGRVSKELAPATPDAQGTLFDTEGNITGELQLETKEASKPLSEYSVDELRAALMDAESRESDTTLDQAYAENDMRDARAHEDTKLDEAYAENERFDSENIGNTQEQVSTPEVTDYTTRIGNATDRISQWLGNKAEKYEAVGGAKGYAKKLLRRMGKAAYKRSGLEAGVNKTRLAADKINDFADRVDESITNSIENRKKNKREALERRAQRAQERREKEVMDYVKSQHESDAPTEKNSKEKRQERRQKANERKEHRRSINRDIRQARIEMMQVYWDTSRVKQIGRIASRYARGAKGAVIGAVNGARTGASAEMNR